MEKESTSCRLKKIMSERNLRQIDILNMTIPYCRKYGVKMNKSDISQYCSGKTEPNQEKLFVLSKALNVNEAWLMGFDVPVNSQESKNCNDINYHFDYNEEILLTEYRKLNNIGKKKLISTAKEMNCSPLYNKNYREELAAAHKRTDIETDNETIPDDIAIMNNPSEWE